MVGGVGKKNAQDLKALLAKRFLQRERERAQANGVSQRKRGQIKREQKRAVRLRYERLQIHTSFRW